MEIEHAFNEKRQTCWFGQIRATGKAFENLSWAANFLWICILGTTLTNVLFSPCSMTAAGIVREEWQSSSHPNEFRFFESTFRIPFLNRGKKTRHWGSAFPPEHPLSGWCRVLQNCWCLSLRLELEAWAWAWALKKKKKTPWVWGGPPQNFFKKKQTKKPRPQ